LLAVGGVPVLVCIVLPAIEFDHDAPVMREQQQEVHALPNQAGLAGSAGVGIEMDVDLRNESRDA